MDSTPPAFSTRAALKKQTSQAPSGSSRWSALHEDPTAPAFSTRLASKRQSLLASGSPPQPTTGNVDLTAPASSTRLASKKKGSNTPKSSLRQTQKPKSESAPTPMPAKVKANRKRAPPPDSLQSSPNEGAASAHRASARLKHLPAPESSIAPVKKQKKRKASPMSPIQDQLDTLPEGRPPAQHDQPHNESDPHPLLMFTGLDKDAAISILRHFILRVSEERITMFTAKSTLTQQVFGQIVPKEVNMIYHRPRDLETPTSVIVFKHARDADIFTRVIFDPEIDACLPELVARGMRSVPVDESTTSMLSSAIRETTHLGMLTADGWAE